MPTNPTTLHVLLASPNDVSAERDVAQEVIEDLNVSLRGSNIRVELIRWEQHSRPGLGRDGQEVINRQLGDEYDILIGIMWARFGSPTQRAGSGTEEEFNQALEKAQKHGAHVEIMFYFKASGPMRLEEIDVDQLKKVQAFKARLREHGLQREFTDADDFRRQLHMHLGRLVRTWPQPHPATQQQPPPPAIDTGSTTSVATAKDGGDNPLANLSELDGSAEGVDYGVLDLVDQTVDAMNATTAIAGRLTDATHALGEQFQRRTEEVNALRDGQDMVQRKRIVNNSANDLEHFVNRLAVEIPELYVQQSTSMDALGSIVTASGRDLAESHEVVTELRSNLRGYIDGLQSAASGVKELRGVVSGMPRLTNNFVRARRRTIAVLDDLATQLERAIRQIEDVEQLLPQE